MRIVAVVGADGAGKSTQAGLLESRLKARGYKATCVRPVFLLFDPWRHKDHRGLARAVSPRLRRLGRLKGAANGGSRAGLTPRLGYLYALASYAYLRLALRRWDFVVCDRYFYEFFYDLFGPAGGQVAKSFPRPDLTVWLDASVDRIQERAAERADEEPGRPYLEAIIDYYRGLSPALGFRRIDADGDPDRVSAEIWNVLVGGG